MADSIHRSSTSPGELPVVRAAAGALDPHPALRARRAVLEAELGRLVVELDLLGQEALDTDHGRALDAESGRLSELILETPARSIAGCGAQLQHVADIIASEIGDRDNRLAGQVRRIAADLANLEAEHV